MTLKTPILRDPRYIASFKIPGEHHCLLTGAEMPDGAHIRHGFYVMGIKPGDDLIIPLAHRLHAEQHQMGEEQFWSQHWHGLLARTARPPEGGSIMYYVKQVARDYYADWEKCK